MSALSLRVGVVWTAAGNAVYVACQYGMLVALAKLGTREDVGTFAIALAVTAPIVVLSQLQLRQLQVTDVRGEARFGHYLATRLVFTLGALLGTPAVVALAGYDRHTAAVTMAVMLAKALESVADIAHGRLQHVERMDLVARSLALKGLLSLAAFTLALAATGRLLLAVGGMGLAWAAILVAYDVPTVRRRTTADERRLAWQSAIVRRFVKTMLPLTAASALSSFSVNLPRYILDEASGREAVALFAAAATPLVLIQFVWGAVGQATLPRAARYLAEDDLRAFSRLAWALVWLHVAPALAMTALLALYGDAIMSALFAPEYRDAGRVAALMAAALALGGLGAYGATALTAGRHFSLLALQIVVIAVVQLPLTVVLVREFGIWGAAWSEVIRTVVSTLYVTLAGCIMYRRRVRSAETR
jgi:O-antigen/teichoic acid export membrane protein